MLYPCVVWVNTEMDHTCMQWSYQISVVLCIIAACKMTEGRWHIGVKCCRDTKHLIRETEKFLRRITLYHTVTIHYMCLKCGLI